LAVPVLEPAAIVAVVICVLQFELLKNLPPPELLERLRTVGVVSVAAEPLAFSICTLTCDEQVPVIIANWALVKASFGLTVNVCALDVPPPGAEFVTVIGKAPAFATSGAVIEAVTCVELTNVVVRAEPLKLTVEVETKFVPFTVSVNALSPAVFVVGEILVVVGTGLFTVKLTEFEVPPPGEGFVTTTGKLPAVAWSVAVS
jgi:hypothetical protein